MSSSSNSTVKASEDSINGQDRPYTSLIALNGAFNLPMRDLSAVAPTDLDAYSMIVRGQKKSKMSISCTTSIEMPCRVASDDDILNGIHTDDIQPKDDDKEVDAMLEKKQETNRERRSVVQQNDRRNTWLVHDADLRLAFKVSESALRKRGDGCD